MTVRTFFLTLLLLVLAGPLQAQVYNVKVVTDASPDYSDLDSLIHSVTARWPTPQEKCWALFYWNHIARRQTAPMILHGMELTDPIRQFNDYGYTMCSTVAGINCSLWNALGLKVRYWDIASHTVSEVFYDGRWHIYDNSMSALYTLCDGKTIAGVEDVGKPGACAASGGKVEPGHIARYHCLTANGPDSFLTGADTGRSLREEAHCFNPNAIKYRYYFYDWDRGHRYILNLREGETYTRYYHSLGQEAKFYVPNHGRDPDETDQGKSRFRIRGNGVWIFNPPLTAAQLPQCAHQVTNLRAVQRTGFEGGLQPIRAGAAGRGGLQDRRGQCHHQVEDSRLFYRATAADHNAIFISTTNGLTWQELFDNNKIGFLPVSVIWQDPGHYEVLVKFQLQSQETPADTELENVWFEAITMLNSKTQPRLNIGTNTVHVGVGEQTDSLVLWPDLQGGKAKPLIVEQKNMTSRPKHPEYMGVMHTVKPNEEGYVVFRIDTPRDLTRLVYGGRFYNRALRSHIDMLHSFDNGKTWMKSYSLTETRPPWDVIHYETIEHIPPGTRSVLMKYALESSAAGSDACSIYALRMEANYRPAEAAFKPIEVTFRWKEVQADRSLVERCHTELVTRVPHRYTINVGGADHPVVESLQVNLQGSGGIVGFPVCKGEPTPGGNRQGAGGKFTYGYSDGRNAGGEKFIPRWQTRGTNLALGKPYTVSIPSGEHWGSGDPQGTKLTDGIVGPPYAGGPAASYGLCWTEGKQPVITVDLGSKQHCGAFAVHLTGYPFWDALKGEVKDEIEVLTSTDGTTYTSQGRFDFNLRWKDLPANFMAPDEETMTGPVFDLIPPRPVEARYVRVQGHGPAFHADQ